MRQTITTLLAFGGMAFAAPHNARRATAQDLLVGGPSQILTAQFDNNAFKFVGKNVTAGSAPSWLRYKASTNTLYAVNENGDNLNTFTLEHDAQLAPAYVGSATGSSGVVFLEFNQDETRMVGAAYGSEMIDLWDTSATGAPKLLKQIKITGPLGPGQDAHHPHQAVLDPMGSYVIVPDLGGDQLLIIDLQDDNFKVTNTVTLTPGSGPRHGAFIPGAEGEYFYVVATEKSNIVVVYQAEYNDQGLQLKYLSEQSTYGTDPPATPSTAAAGEVLVAGAQDVYISNRLSGNETDSIAHFTFDYNDGSLTYVDTVSTGGILPRSMSLNADWGVIFVANQGGENGLVALARDSLTGKLSDKPLAVVANSDLIPEGMEGTANVGPQFVGIF